MSDSAETINRRLDEYARRARLAVLGAIYQKGLQIIGDAVKICPVDKKFLRDSHYVTLPALANPRVELGFGTDYALDVHYNTTATFKAPGTRALFLAEPMYKHSKDYRSWVLKKARQNFKANRGIPDPDAPTKPNDGGSE